MPSARVCFAVLVVWVVGCIVWVCCVRPALERAQVEGEAEPDPETSSAAELERGTAGVAPLERDEERNSVVEAGSLEVHLQHTARALGAFDVSVRAGASAPIRQAAGLERVQLHALPSGTYAVSAERGGWTCESKRIELRAEPARIELICRPLLTVSGSVHAHDGGEPITSYVVRLEARVTRNGVTLGQGSGEVRVAGADGRFEIAEEASDVVAERVTITAPGYLPATSEWQTVGGGWVTIPPIALARSGDCALVGSVTSARGALPSRAQLVFVPTEATPEITISEHGLGVRIASAAQPSTPSLVDANGLALLRRESDEQGAFRLELPCDTGGRLVAWVAGFAPWVSEPFETRTRSEQPMRIELAPTRRVQCHLLQGGRSQLDVLVSGVSVRHGERVEALRLRSVGDGETKAFEYECETELVGRVAIEVSGRQYQSESSADVVLLRKMVELPDGDCELTLHLDTGISGRSLRAIVSLPPTIDRARAVAALFDSTSPDALRRGFVGDGGIVEFDDLESGTYTLCIQASTTDLGEKALHSQAVTLSDADVHLGIVEVGTKKRTTLHLPEAARTGSGIVRIGCTSCPGGKLSPLTEHILLRANAERPLVIHGLPVGKYELINAQGGATYVFVSEVVAGNEEPAVQAR